MTMNVTSVMTNRLTVSRHRTMALAVAAMGRLAKALAAVGVGEPDYVVVALPAVRGPEWHVVVHSYDSEPVALLTVTNALMNEAA